MMRLYVKPVPIPISRIGEATIVLSRCDMTCISRGENNATQQRVNSENMKHKSEGMVDYIHMWNVPLIPCFFFNHTLYVRPLKRNETRQLLANFVQKYVEYKGTKMCRTLSMPDLPWTGKHSISHSDVNFTGKVVWCTGMSNSPCCTKKY